MLTSTIFLIVASTMKYFSFTKEDNSICENYPLYSYHCTGTRVKSAFLILKIFYHCHMTWHDMSLLHDIVTWQVTAPSNNLKITQWLLILLMGRRPKSQLLLLINSLHQWPRWPQVIQGPVLPVHLILLQHPISPPPPKNSQIFIRLLLPIL